ncbi:MAG: EAL domain-containing protein [Rhodoferax sp.]|nr:EAL domain-containing protein [Rhodoferax sp.]
MKMLPQSRTLTRSWSLRLRILVYLGCLLAGVGLVGYEVTDYLVERNVAAFEEREAQAHMDRAVLGVTQSISGMDVVVYDNATWNDTFAHLQHFNAEYLSTNYTAAALRNLKVEQVIFLTPQAHLHSAVELVGESVQTLSADSPLVQAAQRAVMDVPLPAPMRGRHLLRWVNGHALAIAYAAVRRSDAGPQIAGWMVLVRDLDQSTAALEQVIGNELVFSPDKHTQVNQRVQTLPDSVGESEIHLKITAEPALTDQSTQVGYLLLLNSTLMSLIAILLVGLLLDGLVLRRLSLFAALARADKSDKSDKSNEDENAPVTKWPVLGTDELDVLAVSLNAMVMERSLTENQLKSEARTDLLTGLGNRRHLLESMERVFAQVRRGQTMDLSVFLLDLDGFKHINDSLGHEAGDAMLVWIGHQIAHAIRDSDLAVRLGGDEFAVFSFMPQGKQDVDVFAERILRVVSRPHTYHGQVLVSSASLGVVVADPTQPAEVALRNADIAMYAAKNLGKNRYTVFTDAMHSDVQERMQLEQHLRQAIKDRAFDVWFQPIVDIRSGKTAMVEALARLKIHGKFCPPDRFIALAEDAGLIGAIGQELAEKAVEALSRLHKVLPGLIVNINLSAHQLMDPGLPDFLNATLQKNAVSVEHVHLELTETAVARDSEQLLAMLVQLANAGYHLHLDDFGTGQSSLNRVQDLPFSSLKLDKSFVDLLLKDVDTIPRLMISLAQELDMQVIAEGVESLEQVGMLKEMGYFLIQGYVFAKPMPEDVLLQWLQEQKSRG